MHGAVRSLYKRLLVAAREYPGGSAVGTKKVKEAFMKRADADISDPVVLEQSVRQGEFVLKELDALRRLHKYRYVVFSHFVCGYDLQRLM